MPLLNYIKLECDVCGTASDMIHEKKLPEAQGGWVILNKLKEPLVLTEFCPKCGKPMLAGGICCPTTVTYTPPDTTPCPQGTLSFRQCCCTCKHRLIDQSHPLTDGKPMSHNRGYICNNPDLGAFSGWSEHGLCECWELKVPITPGG